MEVILGAFALFVCFLIVPAFLVGLGFAAAIPLAALGFAGNLISGSRARGVQGQAREPGRNRSVLTPELPRDRAA